MFSTEEDNFRIVEKIHRIFTGEFISFFLLQLEQPGALVECKN